jgi:hypothetical protein
MSNLYELAEFLVASWKLANPEGKMPTSHGILDAALDRVKDQLPARFAGKLTFGNTRVGFRCYELPQILYCAQANLLTSEPNPTYLTTEVQISEETALVLLYRRDLDATQAEEFGQALGKAVTSVVEEVAGKQNSIAERVSAAI